MFRSEGVGPTDEVLSEHDGHEGKPAKPSPHRRRGHAEGFGNPSVAVPSGRCRQRRADHFCAVAPTQKRVLGDEHVGGLTGSADRAPEAPLVASMEETHLPINTVPPGPQPRGAIGAGQAPIHQLRLDGGLVSPYDEHSGAPASSGRALSRSVERFGEGALTRSVRAHAAPWVPSLARSLPPIPSTPIAASPCWSPNRAHVGWRQTTCWCSINAALNNGHEL